METKTDYNLKDLCNADLATTDPEVARMRGEVDVTQAQQIYEIYNN